MKWNGKRGGLKGRIRRNGRLGRSSLCMIAVFGLLFGGLLGLVTPAPAWAGEVIDFGDRVLECRVTQRGSGDCAIASLATVEAYANGLKNDSQAAYSTVWNKNGGQNYIQSWSNLGYRQYNIGTDLGDDLQAFCQTIYDQLKKGSPCLVRRNSSPTHYSVIVGYSGEGEEFALEDFTIMEVNGQTSSDRALMNLQSWMQVSGGTKLDQVVIRQAGVGPISTDDYDTEKPEVTPNIVISGETYPESTHLKGEFCPIKGTITSANLLHSVKAEVRTSLGDVIYSKTVKPASRTYNLTGVNNDMAISKLDLGDYVYEVAAQDSTGYEQTVVKVSFSVAANSSGGGQAADGSQDAAGSGNTVPSRGGESRLPSDGTQGAYNHILTLQIGNSMMNVDGTATPIDTSGTVPMILNGRTILPLRGVLEAMGAALAWNEEDQIVGINKDGKWLYLQIGNGQAWDPTGNHYVLDTAPVLMNERTMLPIRFVVEYYGGAVEWSEETQSVLVAY